ncbi:MAG: hypothetical protein FJ088_13720, partial [Deltaproteobacteria bacterium]|nr:hypothetical protein [Deltaproteobacteria bacterium]
TVEMALLKKASGLYLDTLHDYETALNVTERLIEIEPNDINTLKTLNTLYGRLHRNPERVPVLETIASLVHETQERRELYYEMAELSRQLGDDETSVKGYSYVVDYRPDDSAIDPLTHKSIEMLLILHENAGNYWHLTQVLRILGEFSKDDRQAREAYVRIAGIYDTKLDRPDEAMKVYEILHRKFPAEIEIIKDLKLYLYRLSEWERLEAVLKDELAVSPPDGRIRVLTELCDNYISKIGSLDSALRILEEIIASEPSSEYAWENLKPFIHRHEYAEKAGELMKASCMRRGEFGKAVELIKMLRDVPHLKRKSVEYDVELAHIFEERLNDPFSALEIAERLFADNPSDDMFGRYVALLKKCGKIAELPSGVEKAAARVKDPGGRIALRLKAAEALYSAGLHKKAAEALRSNLADRKNDAPTLDFLERIFNETSDTKGIVELLEIRCELA